MTEAAETVLRCPRCRAIQRDGRLTLRYLGHRAREEVFGVERGLWPTAWHLLVKPRAVVEAFVRGDEPRYFNPITYFLVATAVSLLFTPKLPLFDAAVAGMLGKNVFASEELARQWVADWNSLLYAPLMLLLAVAMRLLLRARGLNLAEHLVITAYAWAQMLVISTLAFVVVAALKSVGIRGLWLAPLLLASTLYWLWYCRSVFRVSSLADWLRCLVALPLAWGLYLIGMLALTPLAKLVVDALA